MVQGGLTDQRKGAPGCTGIGYLMIMLARGMGQRLEGAGTLYFARAFKGLKGAKVCLHEAVQAAAVGGRGSTQGACVPVWMTDGGVNRQMDSWMGRYVPHASVCPCMHTYKHVCPSIHQSSLQA